MPDLIASLSQSTAAMEAQSRRLRHLSENVANADTPGYRRKTVDFFQDTLRSEVRLGPVRLDQTPLPRIHAPSHPMADETGHYEGSNVNMLIELADAREAQRSYEANLRMFDQARQMTQGLIELLRR
jgi:flagellar basal-body rod protein FlgC